MLASLVFLTLLTGLRAEAAGQERRNAVAAYDAVQFFSQAANVSDMILHKSGDLYGPCGAFLFWTPCKQEPRHPPPPPPPKNNKEKHKEV